MSVAPNKVTDDTQIVSLNSTDNTPVISQTHYTQCYSSGSLLNNTVSTITWTTNNTNVKFSSLFTLSPNSQVATT